RGEIPVLAEHHSHVTQAEQMQGKGYPVDSGYQVFDLQVVGRDGGNLAIMQPQGASPVQPGVAFRLVAGHEKPCPPTGSDQYDVAPPDGHSLGAYHVVQLFRRDRVSRFQEDVCPAMANQVQKHAARGDALAVDLVDAAMVGAHARHRIRRKAVVELVLVVDV